MQNKHELDDRAKTDWQNLPVHPAAEMLPMMSDEEIEELRRDILENGLVEPFDVWIDNHAEAAEGKGPFPMYKMDGRNRDEVLKREGHRNPFEVHTRGVRYHNAIKYDRKRKSWVPDCDPVKFILSKNVHRRHLTPEQKREAIARYLKADPQASNRKVAKELKVSHHTVAGVRASNGQNAQPTRMERAKAAIVANPDASGRELAKIAGVGEATVRRARKELATAPEPKTNPTEPTPTEPVGDASAKVEASSTTRSATDLTANDDASSRKDLTDAVVADVRVALDSVWAKWRGNPDVDWNLFITAVERFIETGANY